MNRTLKSRPARPTRLAAALACALAGAALAPGLALAAPPPGDVFSRPQFADVIAAAQPAVVKIEVEKRGAGVARMDGPGSLPRGPFAPFFAPPGPSGDDGHGRVSGLGSGFIIDAAGHVVTNHHVIADASHIEVVLNDGRRLPARVVGSDEATDLALLEAEGADGLPHLEFGDSDRARVGDWVVAIGNPFGLNGSVSAGIISARGRDLDNGPYDDYLQIDAPINSGNSGGPLLGADGRVVGVNTAIYSPNGGNIGIGFAIPAAEVQEVVAALRRDGRVERGWLGVQIQPLDTDLARAFEREDTRGALVAAVVPDSPAARAGLRTGDLVLRFDGHAVATPRDLSRAVARAKPGEDVSIELLRQGRSRTVSARVERNATASLARADGQSAAPDEALGLALAPLSPEARRRLELDDSVSGALVVGVKAGGSADASGVEPGDVIVAVDRANVASPGEAAARLSAARRDERPAVVLLRRGASQFFTTLAPA